MHDLRVEAQPEVAREGLPVRQAQIYATYAWTGGDPRGFSE